MARGVYFAELANFADKTGRNPINEWGPGEVHCLSQSAYFDADSSALTRRREIVGLGLEASWVPPAPGWKTAISYYTMHGQKYPRSGKPMENCVLRWSFYAAPKGPYKPSLFWSRAHSLGYSNTFKFGNQRGGNDADPATIYEIAIDNNPLDISLANLDADVSSLLESPEQPSNVVDSLALNSLTTNNRQQRRLSKQPVGLIFH